MSRLMNREGENARVCMRALEAASTPTKCTVHVRGVALHAVEDFAQKVRCCAKVAMRLLRRDKNVPDSYFATNLCVRCQSAIDCSGYSGNFCARACGHGTHAGL